MATNEKGLTPLAEIVKSGTTQIALTALLGRTQGLVVRDQDSYRVARILQKDWDSYIKNVGFELDPGIAKAKASLEHLQDQKRKWADPAKTQREAVREMADNWAAEEKRLAQAEEDARNREIARQQQLKADQERQEAERVAAETRKNRVAEINAQLKAGTIGKREAARLLKEAGAEEEGAKQTAAAVAEETKNAPPPLVKVKPNIPPVSGTKNQTFYFAEVTNAEVLLSAYDIAAAVGNSARKIFLRQFITVDEQAIGRYARDTKDPAKVEKDIPGVKAWSKG